MEPCSTPPPELSLHNRYDPLTQRSVVGRFGVFLTSFGSLLTQIRPTVRLNQWEDWLNWWEREVLLCLWLQRPRRFIDGEILPEFSQFPHQITTTEAHSMYSIFTLFYLVFINIIKRLLFSILHYINEFYRLLCLSCEALGSCNFFCCKALGAAFLD